MGLRDYLSILRRSWILILLVALASTGIAVIVSLLEQPVYVGTAKVFVSAQNASTLSELAQGNSYSVQRVITYSELVATPVVLTPVSEDLNKQVSAAQVTAVARPNSSIIDIVASDVDPVRAADIANSAAKNLAIAVKELEKPADSSVSSPILLSTIQAATPASSPISPKIPLNIALGILIGLAVGFGIAVLRKVLDTRVHSERELKEISDLPVLGGIVFDSKASQRPLIVHDDPRSPRAEAFRTLRTSLQFLDHDRENQSYVVSSTLPAEGKSTTTANLAIAIADSGLTVVIVEADLRQPKVTEYLGLEGAAGLTDVLIDRFDLKEVIQRWGKTTLYVLPAGKIPPNPSELLGSKSMDTTIERLNKAFDVVLFDCPPLLPVTDASILAKKVGGLLLVVAAGRAQKTHVQAVLAGLQNVGAHVSGIILTMLPAKGPNAYGYGAYGAYGAYGDSYVEPDDSDTRVESRRGRKKRSELREI